MLYQLSPPPDGGELSIAGRGFGCKKSLIVKIPVRRRIKPMLSLLPLGSALEDSQPILQIDSDRFRMHTQDESAWSFPTDDGSLTRAMRDGNDLTIESTSWRGTEIRDTFSLAGVTAMHDLISQEWG